MALPLNGEENSFKGTAQREPLLKFTPSPIRARQLKKMMTRLRHMKHAGFLPMQVGFSAHILEFYHCSGFEYDWNVECILPKKAIRINHKDFKMLAVCKVILSIKSVCLVCVAHALCCLFCFA